MNTMPVLCQVFLKLVACYAGAGYAEVAEAWTKDSSSQGCRTSMAIFPSAFHQPVPGTLQSLVGG